jgi:hypothetical protein
MARMPCATSANRTPDGDMSLNFLYLFFHDFRKMNAPEKHYEIYTPAAVWHGVRNQTPYHTAAGFQTSYHMAFGP